MQRLDELEECCNKYRLRFLEDAMNILDLIKTVKAQDKALKWYSENGNYIDISYIKDETLVNLWKDISTTAKDCMRQTEKDWGTLEGQDKTEGKEL